MGALGFEWGLSFLFPVLLSNPSYGVHAGILQNRRDDVRFFPRKRNGFYSTEGMSIRSIAEKLRRAYFRASRHRPHRTV